MQRTRTLWCPNNEIVRLGWRGGGCGCVHVCMVCAGGGGGGKRVVWRRDKGAHRGGYRRRWPGLQNQTFRGTHGKPPTPPHPRCHRRGPDPPPRREKDALPLFRPFFGLFSSPEFPAKSLPERGMSIGVVLFYSCAWLQSRERSH